MKTPFLIFSLLILVSSLIRAQEVAPFQYKDKDAIRLTEKKLAPIFDTTWVCLKMYFTNREEKSTTPFRHTLKISADGTWLVSLRGVFGGSWQIENNRLLVLNFDNEKNETIPFIGGGYSVLKISDDELVIAKNLTSVFDNSIVYTYTRKENYDKYSEVGKYKKARIANANKNKETRKERLIRTIEEMYNKKEMQPEKGLDQKSEEELTEIRKELYLEKIEKMDESELRKQLTMEYFMRGMKSPNGFANLNKEELRELLGTVQ